MSPWPFNVYIDRVMKVKMKMERRGVSFLEDESGDCLASCMQILLSYLNIL